MTMTLDDAIKHCEEVAEANERSCKAKPHANLESYLECAAQHRQLAEWLKELKQLREQTSWIPVSERLPDIHNCFQECLITNKHKSVYKAFFTDINGKQWWSVDDVIAWMPLPQPYKGESEDCN